MSHRTLRGIRLANRRLQCRLRSLSHMSASMSRSCFSLRITSIVPQNGGPSRLLQTFTVRWDAAVAPAFPATDNYRISALLHTGQIASNC